MKLDYEQFFAEALTHFKDLKEKTDIQSKTVKRVEKCICDGNINALPRLYTVLRETAKMREEALDRMEALTRSFDGHEYISSGDFSAQMIDYCKQLGVDVQGSFPVYDMFPCKVTINVETQDVLVDRKRFQCLRPQKLVNDIKMEITKMSKASFNASLFAKELAAAYDLAIVKASKKKSLNVNASIYALELYDIMTPMRRHKKEYTKNNFAFDLARLYAEENITLDDGRMLRFDTVRDMRKSIRILDRNGLEQFITTIRYTGGGSL
jgi:hypothetical protein